MKARNLLPRTEPRWEIVIVLDSGTRLRTNMQFTDRDMAKSCCERLNENPGAKILGAVHEVELVTI